MDEEFMNTLRNIGTKWYQCPKGHAYTIGECGLAMVESICPECGERIGGKDHKLLKTNKMVDFDLDVKNNINITPVKVINKQDEANKEIKDDKENKNKESDTINCKKDNNNNDNNNTKIDENKDKNRAKSKDKEKNKTEKEDK